MPDSRSNADWLSFILHFLFGLAVGAVLGFFSISSDRHFLLRDDLILPFVSGAALIAGGFGARWGDKLWMNSSQAIFGSDAPRHNRMSKWLCHLSILSGTVIAVTAVFKQFHR